MRSPRSRHRATIGHRRDGRGSFARLRPGGTRGLPGGEPDVMPSTDLRSEEPPPPRLGGPKETLFPWRKLLALIPVVALLWVLYFIRIPYFVISPGPAQDVLPLIHVDGRTVYPPGGHLLLTAVNLGQPNVYEALWAWLDTAETVVPERDFLAPGESEQQEVRRQLSEMDTSKIDAAYVALHAYTGYPAHHGQGVLVESVLPGTPADGKLFAGDLIQSIDGKPVQDPDALSNMIRTAGVGRALTIR